MGSPDHKHLIVRSEVTRPPTPDNCAAVEQWILALIRQLNMQVLAAPRAFYCDDEGNRGMTADALITTSHIVLHTWDECDPPVMQLDIYTCSDLPLDLAFSALETWGTIESRTNWHLLDREASGEIRLMASGRR